MLSLQVQLELFSEALLDRGQSCRVWILGVQNLSCQGPPDLVQLFLLFEMSRHI